MIVLLAGNEGSRNAKTTPIKKKYRKNASNFAVGITEIVGIKLILLTEISHKYKNLDFTCLVFRLSHHNWSRSFVAYTVRSKTSEIGLEFFLNRK